ncbi:hypothetical protein ABS315_19190 [Peribacillus frigoritolerans]|uniref:hypothetical protein n=1 Tax=Peribacillus frigoritolerans TaxID=450367 RepID=UPI0034E095A5
MDVEVTTTEDNQRVKIDGNILTRVGVDSNAANFQFFVDYELNLGASTLQDSEVKANYNRAPGPGVQSLYAWNSNFTFVHVPGPVGTYIYTVTATDVIGRAGITFIQATSLGLTATVYPPA